MLTPPLHHYWKVPGRKYSTLTDHRQPHHITDIFSLSWHSLYSRSSLVLNTSQYSCFSGIFTSKFTFSQGYKKYLSSIKTMSFEFSNDHSALSHHTIPRYLRSISINLSFKIPLGVSLTFIPCTTSPFHVILFMTPSCLGPYFL